VLTGSWLRVTLKVLFVLLLGILVQTIFASDLRVNDVAPDFMMLLAICAGFEGGPDAGAAVGFGAGLLSDLFLQGTPFGLSALAACLAGFVAGWTSANFLREGLSLAPVVAAVGTALGVVLFVVIGYLVGENQLVAPGQSWLVEVAVVEATYAAIFALPAALLMRWALRGSSSVPDVLGAGPTGGLPEPSSRRRGTARSRRRRRARARVG
jgi:rod shape-determining protein MreD